MRFLIVFFSAQVYAPAALKKKPGKLAWQDIRLVCGRCCGVKMYMHNKTGGGGLNRKLLLLVMYII